MTVKKLARQLLLRQANDLRRLYTDNTDLPPSPDKSWAVCWRAVRKEGGWVKQNPADAFRVMAVDAIGQRMKDVENGTKTEFMVEYYDVWKDYSNEDILDLVQYVLTLEMK